MRSTGTFIVALLAATSANAIKITYPTKGETLPIASGIKVKWTTVSTDPATAHLFLVNMAGGHTPFSRDLGEIDLSIGSAVISEKDVPADTTYQFNFQSVDPQNTGILAQSEQFGIINMGGSEPDIESILIVDTTRASAKTPATATADLGGTVATTLSTTTSVSAIGNAAETDATESVTGSATVTGSAAASTSSLAESGADIRKGGSMLALVAAAVVALVL